MGKSLPSLCSSSHVDSQSGAFSRTRGGRLGDLRPIPLGPRESRQADDMYIRQVTAHCACSGATAIATEDESMAVQQPLPQGTSQGIILARSCMDFKICLASDTALLMVEAPV